MWPYDRHQQRFSSHFSWLNKNDRLIQDVGPIRKEGADLLFENPQQIDSGNYTFIVNNTAGEKRQSVWIIVSGTKLVLFVLLLYLLHAHTFAYN